MCQAEIFGEMILLLDYSLPLSHCSTSTHSCHVQPSDKDGGECVQVVPGRRLLWLC